MKKNEQDGDWAILTTGTDTDNYTDPAAACPQGDDGPPSSPPTPPPGPDDFWYRANPFYLLSVLFMFLGLLLALQASHAGTAVETILAFQGVQHLYEFIMLGMAVYLLRQSIQPGHARFLLVFVLLFLCDLTFFQARITAMAAAAGRYSLAATVLSLNLLLAALKLALAVRFLGLRLNLALAFQGLGTLALLAFAPLGVYWRFDAAVSGTAGESVAFQGHWEVYLLWLLASLLPLPFIVGHWHRTWQETDSDLLAVDELNGTLFWKSFSLVPFLLLPISLLCNVHADVRSMNPLFSDAGYCLIPWALSGIFYLGILFREPIEALIGEASWDFFQLGLLFLIHLALRPAAPIFGEVSWTPPQINMLMIMGGLLACGVTRANTACLGVFVCALLGNSYESICEGGNCLRHFLGELPYTVWAALTMFLAFLSLGTGFVWSLKGRMQVEERTH